MRNAEQKSKHKTNVNSRDVKDVDVHSAFALPQECERPYTVSEINAGIAKIIDEHTSVVWVEGEVSGWKSYPSGHCYFKLKDATSVISAVMWKSSADKLDFTPSDDMSVVAIAKISVYEKSGNYQLNVLKMTMSGVGALHLAFEKLKEKLLREGLFDETRKRPLPSSVNNLGVITSKNGAALWDIVRVVTRRAPQTNIVVIDTAVQGERAAPQIAKAIETMNEYNKVDAIIVGRGGGSIEDLWAFNEEVVARAIYNSRIPIISAVGHEIDFTIADFVADVRAPTPSAAAEIAVADTKESARHFQYFRERFLSAFSNYINDAFEKVEQLKTSRAMQRPQKLIEEAQQSLDNANSGLYKNMKLNLQKRSDRLKSCAHRLHSLSPLSTLGRGYAIIQDNNKTPIKSISAIKNGDNVTIKLIDGTADAQVISTSEIAK